MPLREANEIEPIDVTEDLVDWLASDLGLASDGSCLPQSAACLGVHVGSFLRHLSQPEVADVVESAITNCSCIMALGSLPFGLAWNGCRGFSGCQATSSTACANNLDLGDHRNVSRSGSALGCGALYSATSAAAARVGGNVGSNPAASLRYFPNRRSPVAEPWCQSTSHHVCASPLDLPG